MVIFGLLTPAEIALTLGKRLQKQRIQQNKTQAQLAQHIGVSTPTISNLENGKNTSLETFINVTLALGLSQELEKLFTPPSLTIAQLEKLQKPARQRASKVSKAVPVKTNTTQEFEALVNKYSLKQSKKKSND